jgi:site-specific DNA recombinase
VVGVLTDLHEAGVSVVEYLSGNAVRMDTPTDILIASVGAFAAADYRYQVGLKTKGNMLDKAKQGHWLGTRTYGYAAVQVGDHAERRIDPDQATVVLRVFERCAAGDGDAKIAKSLNAEQIPAPGRYGWSKQTIAAMLRNELYAGVMVYGKTTSRDKGGRAGLRTRTASTTWKRIDCPDLRIVPSDVWTAVARTGRACPSPSWTPRCTRRCASS